MNTSKLVNFRKELGLTQRDMAQRMGLSDSGYAGVEQGVRKPSYAFICRFKGAFPNIDIDAIFFADELHRTRGKAG